MSSFAGSRKPSFSRCLTAQCLDQRSETSTPMETMARKRYDGWTVLPGAEGGELWPGGGADAVALGSTGVPGSMRATGATGAAGVFVSAVGAASPSFGRGGGTSDIEEGVSTPGP